jgi:uncharacterized membrane protein YdjX (TVP38/TMEM64 family)
MIHVKRSWIALAIWALIIFTGLYLMHAYHIPFRRIPLFLRHLVRVAGSFGPWLIVGLYLVRIVIVVIPASMINILAATLYGPWMGMALALIGENISATIAFYIARFIGRKDVAQSTQTWMKKIDDVINDHGFYSILSLRVFFVPFDVINVLAGVSAVSYRSFFFATFFGILPSVFALSFGGEVFQNTDSSLIIGVSIVALYAFLLFLRRQPRILRMLGEKV